MTTTGRLETVTSVHNDRAQNPNLPGNDQDGTTPVDADRNNDGEVSVRERFVFVKRMWRAAPRSLRRSVAGVVGTTLVLLGAALVVLPGPFTVPLVIAGLGVLASEFAWAERLLMQGRAHASRLTRAVRRSTRR
jgi:hypothetical protein